MKISLFMEQTGKGMVSSLTSLGLDVLGSNRSLPAGDEENLVSEHASLGVICRDYMNTVPHPLDQAIN